MTSSLTTDLPVQFSDIRVGDYIIATSDSGARSREGFVTALDSNTRSLDMILECLDDVTLSDNRRTWARRTHAMNPQLTLVHPGHLVVGDWAAAYNIRNDGDEATGTVTDLQTSWVFLDGGAYSRTQRQWFRLLPQGAEPVVGAWVSAVSLLGYDTVSGQVTHVDGSSVFIDGVHVIRYMRRFEAYSPPAPEPTPLYPSIHHLRAKLFDIILANSRSHVWCAEGASDFAQELGLATDLYEGEGLQDQADQVEALVARLRAADARVRNVSEASVAQAFRDLGIPRTVEPLAPVTKRVQLEVEVPVTLTPEQIHDFLVQSEHVTSVIRNQEVPR